MVFTDGDGVTVHQFHPRKMVSVQFFATVGAGHGRGELPRPREERQIERPWQALSGRGRVWPRAQFVWVFQGFWGSVQSVSELWGSVHGVSRRFEYVNGVSGRKIDNPRPT